MHLVQDKENSFARAPYLNEKHYPTQVTQRRVIVEFNENRDHIVLYQLQLRFRVSCFVGIGVNVHGMLRAIIN
jgi:hypothetical protein